ncbi:hypothetical protein SEA_MASHLEY_85 [Microbacterium phage Mashley]|nr:hypothetical protein SEA_MASHLEY_85 [Microbacterium phage Mashley]
MSIATPREIATDALTGYALGADITREDVWQLIVDVIEAERKRGRWILLSEHDDTGIVGSYDSHEDAEAAARDNMHSDDADDWDDYYSIQEV